VNNTKPIHLRNDEYNSYIEECKEKLTIKEGELTLEEKHVIYRCGVDYGLTFDASVVTENYEIAQRDYNIILRVKGPYTLPEQASFSSEHGVIKVRPYIIHEFVSAQRLKFISEDIFAKDLVDSVVPIDGEYIYEALRESAFTIAMEEVVKLGTGFQILQIEFDTIGHFKAIELDESHY
jgi:hypothetical protein